MLDFALFLKERQLAWGWDAISDERAAALKAEFAAVDTAFSEAVLTNYLDLSHDLFLIRNSPGHHRPGLTTDYTENLKENP